MPRAEDQAAKSRLYRGGDKGPATLRGDEDDRQHARRGLEDKGAFEGVISNLAPRCTPVMTQLREKECTPPEYLLCARHS